MPLDFPASPSLNDTYSFGGKTWIWNGEYWRLNATGAINDIPIGNITASTGNFTTLSVQTGVASDLTPTANVTYDLGNSDHRWNDLWLANSTIHIGNGSISANATSLILTNPNGTSFSGGGDSGVLTWTTQANTAPSPANPGDFWYDSFSQIKYQYTNDGTSNVWVDQSAPTTFQSISTGQIVNTNANSMGNIGGSGLYFGNLFVATVNAATISATGNIVGNYILGNGSQLTGISGGSGSSIANGTSNITISTADGDVDITVAGSPIANINADGFNTSGNISANYFLGNGALLTGVITSVSDISNGTSNVSIASVDGDVSVTVGGTAILSVTADGIINNQANGVGNIGNATAQFDTIFAKATSAQYADLAERYLADQDYEPGTVVIFGGTQEITQSIRSHDPRVAGIISTQPALIMNNSARGLLVALTGRVPCRVQGPVTKGDLLVTSDNPGTAQKLESWTPGCVIGKSLEDIDRYDLATIEVAVGRF